MFINEIEKSSPIIMQIGLFLRRESPNVLWGGSKVDKVDALVKQRKNVWNLY